MAIKIDCHRCQSRLRVPNKLAGGYVRCPRCKGRLWVAKDAPADATQTDVIGVANGDPVPAADAPFPPPGPLPESLPLRGVPGAVVPLRSSPSPPSAPPVARGPKEPALPAAPPTPPAAPPVSRKRVAHLVTAEAADSTLRLAADGKLPELRLEESDAAEKEEASAKSVNPLLLLAVLSMSIVLSAALVFVDWSPQKASQAEKKAAMRQKIEEKYLGSGTIDNKSLEPYQILLGDAQLADSHGDFRAERDCYRKVLLMLHAERDVHETGLTGSRTRDKELDDAINVLLEGG